MSNMFRVLSWVWRAKLALQRLLIVLSSLAITVLIFVQVISRYVFETAIFGIEEIACFVAVWLYFLGAAVGAEQRGHMSASLVELVLRGETTQRLVRLIVCTLSVVLCGWMTVWAWSLAKWSLQLGMMSTEINVPVGYAQLAMPVGLALMTLYFLSELIETIVLWKRSRAPHA
ncbi:TRAP transporter small permease [Stutzerimonas nitrititolerans]|uniref:TRAP transporter small permease n=1 Tax=Stutzerimonas nitrititolerans TaxID=2482751 RepID=UPI00289B4B6A|nr:TRAP transporter small permease [Stutzerimonas nitrititolerans]